MKRSGQNLRVQKWVAGISIVLLAAKIVAYYYTHSVAVLTDALESIVNVAASLIGLYSLTVSARPRDKDHPYGHGKAEFLSAAVEGTLIGVAGTVILYEAIRNLVNPVELRSLDTGLWLVGLTAVVNFAMGYVCVRIGKRNHSLALEASGRHLQTDTYSTLGIIAGLLAIYFTGYAWIDAAVAMFFGGFIIFTGYKIIRQSIAGIMDEADEKLLSTLVHLLDHNRRENWVDLHNLRVIKYGSVLHLDCHLTVPWYINVYEAHEEVEALSAIVKRDFGEAIEMFVHSDGCMPFQCPICDKKNCHVRQHDFVKEISWTSENIRSDQKHRYQEYDKDYNQMEA